MNNYRKRFLETVVKEIRSPSIRKMIMTELEHHIDKEKQRFITSGKSEEAAEEKAVAQMGNPVTLGKELKKLHRPKVDWWIAVLLMMALCLGFLPLLAMDENLGFVPHKIIYTIVGLVITGGLILVDYSKIVKFRWASYLGGLFLLVFLILFPTAYVNGFPSVELGPLVFNILDTIPFFFISWTGFLKDKRMNGLILCIFFLIPFLLFAFIGNVLAMLFCSFILIGMIVWAEMARLKKIYLLIMGASGLVISLAARLKTYVTGEHTQETTFVYSNIQEVLTNAKWLWMGEGNRTAAVPEAHTDFALVTIIQQFGWLAGLFTLIVLFGLLARMLFIFPRVNDPLGKVLIGGGVSLLAFQIFYNLGMVLGFFPLVGVSLPFISYGSFPIELNAIVLGLVLSVYRRKSIFNAINME
ncbi:FtsW/RodA/SpoVE family cell cycle protein [Sediminibacillus halophilus]|uniref:Cell division protein FtsW, lipid II flippase n=1 Tax=Sediminibacillus halophilus TaxID=482461 RepID=A0A1G9PAB5_9BACI|nr:FtsW/RodA/SpoVE family cell cycle protein [Sediminibacillus halophilus]SDL95736.1 cell division protein FtsW, lipid II flippase [Sediminibacillus halophilus]